MSERPIAVGDLVVVTGSCCERMAEKNPVRGAVRTVNELEISGLASCEFCGHIMKSFSFARFSERGNGTPTAWLKRIPPLSELEGERTEEKERA